MKRIGSERPRRHVGVAMLLILSVFPVSLFAGSLYALALLPLAIAIALRGVSLSLVSDPPPPDAERGVNPSLKLRGSMAADLALLALWEQSSHLKMIPDLPRVGRDLTAAAVRADARGDDLASAHPAPPPIDNITVEGTSDVTVGAYEHLSFESGFEPIDPEIRDEWAAFAKNRTAHAYMFRHDGPPRPTLISIHGYQHGMFAADVRMLKMRGVPVPWLHETLGLNVVMFTLPLHGPRAIGKRSGSDFLDGHPLYTQAAMCQAIWDLRKLLGWLRADGAPSIGVQGTSLGGYTGGLLSSLEELDSVVAIYPLSDLAQLMFTLMSGWRQGILAKEGIDEELISRAWAAHTPLRLAPKGPKERRLVVGARYDRVIPPSHPTAIWEHWDRPQIEWIEATHAMWLGGEELNSLVEAHLRKTLVAGASQPHRSDS